MWFKKLLILLLLPIALKAEEELTLPYLKKKRLDVQLNYQQLDPKKTYGEIKSGQLTFSQPINPSTTLLYNLTFVTRKEGKGVLGQFGAYRDWHERIYTFTALSAATRAGFLPRYRIDQEFYFKVSSQKSLVIPATVSYASYHNKQGSLIFGSGVVWYLPCWILEYRLFLETTYPGSSQSLSQTASVGYGKEDWQWIFLSGGYGRNSYLANLDVEPQNVNQRVAFVNLNWRRWLFSNFGFITDCRFTDIKDAYRVYSISLGLFVEF